MSSVFVNPGIYSYAVDAFLEISTHLICFFHIYQVYVLGMIFNVCSHYMCSREDESSVPRFPEGLSDPTVHY